MDVLRSHGVETMISPSDLRQLGVLSSPSQRFLQACVGDLYLSFYGVDRIITSIDAKVRSIVSNCGLQYSSYILASEVVVQLGFHRTTITRVRSLAQSVRRRRASVGLRIVSSISGSAQEGSRVLLPS